MSPRQEHREGTQVPPPRQVPLVSSSPKPCPGELSSAQGCPTAVLRELRKPGKDEAGPGVRVCPDNPAGLGAAGSSLPLQEDGKETGEAMD